MADKSSIEWLRDPATGTQGATWNPVTGCTDADPSCRFCYAKRLAATRLRTSERYEGVATMGDQRPQWTGAIRLHEDLLGKPSEWTRGRSIFVCSMSDLFHVDVPDDFISKVFAAMARAPQHLYWVLTKRIGRALSWLSGREPHHRVLIGTSAGRQAELVERWPLLALTPAHTRYLSLEPLIGPIDLAYLFDGADVLPDLVIAGGESGPGARPAHPDWFRVIRDDCARFSVPFHFKQWGAWSPTGGHGIWVDREGKFDESPGAAAMVRTSKKLNGRKLDGVEHNGFPRGLS